MLMPFMRRNTEEQCIMRIKNLPLELSRRRLDFVKQMARGGMVRNPTTDTGSTEEQAAKDKEAKHAEELVRK
eukprot:1708542-Karenia_brevis.AAC.1